MKLADAVEALYRCFERYPLEGAEGFCTFCHSEERIRGFAAAPLRDLGGELGRALLWESADHWPSDAAYKHFLPRLLELLAPPHGLDPLYPLHPYEVLCLRGFRRWPADEQRAVRDYVAAVGDEEAAGFLGPAFEPCGEVVLEAHCPMAIVKRPWASLVGFAGARWPNDARPPGELSVCELVVVAPFRAGPGEPFHVLWEPPGVASDGFEPGEDPRLADLRLVECRLLSEIERAQGTPARARLLVEVRSVLDPLALVERVPPTQASLEGLLVDARPGSVQKRLVRAADRVLVETTMQGDINFGMLATPDAASLVLLTDTSICRSFFWAGHAGLDAPDRARLLG